MVQENLSIKLKKRLIYVSFTTQGCYGLNENIGHIDFWPNGGKYQFPCKHLEENELDFNLKGKVFYLQK